MTGRTALVIAVLGTALAVPGNAAAVDHVTLFVSPTKLSRAGWSLSAAVVSPASAGARETFGVTLTRAFANRREEEQHGFRAAPTGTIAFDGRAGRWRARFGTLLAIDMTVTADGLERPIGESQGCRGELSTVPVRLHGSFVLRTGTSFFGTIRRVSLDGSVTYSRGGAVDCAAPAAETCSPSTVLMAQSRASAPAATLLLSPDTGGWLTLSIADRAAAAATWYHVVRIERLGADALAGRPPSFAVEVPAGRVVLGSGTFRAAETTSVTSGPCRRVAVTGTFTGSFRTHFAGWGARTATFGPSAFARFVEESA